MPGGRMQRDTGPPAYLAVFAGQVRGVFFVLVADVFEHIGIRKKFLDDADCEGLRENFRIGNRRGDPRLSHKRAQVFP